MNYNQLMELYAQVPQEMDTPVGNVLNRVGLSQPELANILSRFNVTVGPNPYGQRETQRSEEMSAKIGEFLANLVPYKQSVRGMASQISPVYHGSPYKFNKFKNEAIGSGEGAQAFGYGHYMTEAPEVARQYAETGFQNKVGQYGRMLNEEFTLKRIEQIKKQIDNPELKLFEDAQGKPLSEERLRKYLKGYEEDLAGQREYKAKYGKNIYEATLHKGKKPGEYEYLRWDDDVPKELRAKIFSLLPEKPIGKKVDPQGWFSFKNALLDDSGNVVWRGFDIYRSLADVMGSQEGASKLLKRAGIDGIKYPAGSLSGVKSDKFNYVVFDPEDIAIEAVR